MSKNIDKKLITILMLLISYSNIAAAGNGGYPGSKAETRPNNLQDTGQHEKRIYNTVRTNVAL